MASLQRCVVGVDGSEASAAAFGWALAQADPTEPSEIVAVHGFSPGAELFAAAAQVNLDPARREHERLLNHEWIAEAEGTGIEVRTEIVDDVPAAALLQSSGHHGDTPIIIGHQRHVRWSSHHIGHVAGQLLHHADTPVIIINEATAPEPVFGPVVVAVHEPADISHPPIAWAATFAEEHHLALHVLSVTQPLVAGAGYGYPGAGYAVDLETVQQATRDATRELADALTQAHPTMTVTSEALFGHPTDELAGAISDADEGMVVVGSHHPSALVSFFADGVARRLPTLVTCPVVAIPVG